MAGYSVMDLVAEGKDEDCSFGVFHFMRKRQCDIQSIMKHPGSNGFKICYRNPENPGLEFNCSRLQHFCCAQPVPA